MFMELNYAGDLELEKVMINLDFITCIQKPKKDTFGCIISMDNGEKYPVKETYNEVIDTLKKLHQNGGFRN